MMKNGKLKLIMAAVLMGCAMLLAACGGGDAKEKEYSVKVLDPAGNAAKGVVATFYQGETQVAMTPCEDGGIAKKTLPTGDYTVKLQFTGDANAYYYDAEGLALSKDKTETIVQLMHRPTGDPRVLSVVVGDTTDIMVDAEVRDYNVYNVSVGLNYVDVTTSDRTYFIFMPTEPGKYEVSVENSEGCTIAYYGSDSFVHQTPANEPVNGVTTLSVKEGGINLEPDPETGFLITTQWVLGVDSESLTNCMIHVDRVGDPDWDPSDESWIEYKPSVTLNKYTLSEGTSLKPFDLMAAGYTIVFNEKDGFYHKDTADGPLVYVYLTVNPRYVDCFKTILENDGVRAYIYDDNGKFLRKEAYGPCLQEYIGCADEDEGVYPMTEDLMYIIKTYGKRNGWFDQNDKRYIFTDANGVPIPGINNDIAWLLMCCYAE